MHNHAIAGIFTDTFDQYIAAYCRQPLEHYKVAHCISSCRTSALGGHIYTCDTCGNSVPLYNSCSNRHCPQCQTLGRRRWIEARMDELLPVPYFHAVFTIPHELNPFALRNKKVFYAIMFRGVNETLRTLAQNSKWLGASIGVIAVLHTWGQNLMEHPHIHCIVPAGGLSRDTDAWIPCKHSFLFPFAAMKKLFMAKVLDYLRKAVDDGDITMAGLLECYTDTKAFRAFLSSLYKKKWVIYVKQPFAGPSAVIEYLGNYTHRTAISERRITGVSENTVSFRYKDYADEAKMKVLTLEKIEFIRRFLLHVLPSGFMRIRHYGFLSNARRAQGLKQCAQIFASLREKKKEKKPWYVLLKEHYGIDPRLCKKCGNGIMRRGYFIEPVLRTVVRTT